MLFTHDKKQLLKHFQKDPVLFAYHIGDLDDFYFPDCQWAVTHNTKSKIDNALLIYLGCETPTLLAFGLDDTLGDLLAAFLPIAPRRFYCHFQRQHRDIFTHFAHETPLGTHLKMSLDTDAFKKQSGRTIADNRPDDIVRLGEDDDAALRDLYAAAYPDNYFVPRMLQTGKYFGLRDSGRLVAVAGVHVSSDRDRIAVLGNITTHPRYRGRSLATRLTAHLCAELVDEGKQVCLNVKSDNDPAIACYQKLGFERIHEYQEALFELSL